MTDTSVFFYSADYYKNHQFIRLMRNWNKYLQSDEPDELILAEWEETLLNDFLLEALEWFKMCGADEWWRKGLE